MESADGTEKKAESRSLASLGMTIRSFYR